MVNSIFQFILWFGYEGRWRRSYYLKETFPKYCSRLSRYPWFQTYTISGDEEITFGVNEKSKNSRACNDVLFMHGVDDEIHEDHEVAQALEVDEDSNEI